jgi:hypothetical protein
MAFHIDTYDMPRILNYKHAREVFNSINTVRGETQSVKRLGNRKAKHKWLKLEIVDGIEVYRAGLNSTTLISFYPTHMEMSMGGYWSVSKVKFLERVGWFSINSFNYRDYVPRGYSLDIGASESCVYVNNHIINSKDVYRFNYNREPMDLDRHPVPKKYKVNRKAIKAVRETYQPFYQYVKTMFNLMAVDGKLQEKDIKFTSLIADLMLYIKDENKWFQAFEHLAYRASRYEWGGSGHVKVVRRYYDMLDYVEGSIRFNNPQVLEVVN